MQVQLSSTTNQQQKMEQSFQAQGEIDASSNVNGQHLPKYNPQPDTIQEFNKTNKKDVLIRACPVTEIPFTIPQI